MNQKLNKFLYEYTIEEKISAFVFLLMVLLSFSIAFGEEVGETLLAVAFLPWLYLIRKLDWKYFLTHRITLILISLILIHYISLLWSENIKSGLNYSGSLIRYLLIPLLIFTTITTKKRINYLITAFILGMFINEVISYLIFFGLYETAYSKFTGFSVAYIHHIPYSILVAIAAIMILFQFKDIENRFLKIVYAVFFITMTINLVLTGGRTGLVVYFIILVVLVFIYYKPSVKNIVIVIIFPIAVFFIAYSFNDTMQERVNNTFVAVEKIVKENDYNTSFGARIGFYVMVDDILSQENNSYLLGVGTGDIKNEIIEYTKRSDMYNRLFKHTHNSYLETYLNTGIIGTLLLITLFILIWKVNIKDKEIIFYKHLLVISFLVSMLADHIFRTKEMMLFFVVFTSIVLVQEKFEKMNKKRLINETI